MTDANLTLIGLLVDRSGSMATMQSDMEGGIAAFLESQADVPGRCMVTLAQFDAEYETVYPVTDLSAVPRYHLQPRGATALLDAVGRFVTDTGAQLAALPERERPGKVLIVIVTDGHENSSSEWTAAGVKKLVTDQQEQWNWEFVFLGANIDSFDVAGGLGIAAASTMNFTAAAAPIAMENVASFATRYRSGVADGFSDEERGSSMGS
ncbi:VWA domain-containing protein [Mycobacterium sp. MYCO198283]|uniref:vWA domain-containing protein n=1 Tax=Mycobacterium sp. MYCO198283 TaxID=2883505 RepID=UPI001E44F12D|nr:vWA domain-containing protein [Mycobacterium sp. MYCO198283]MCG5433762.1 VWA domain-containing protein [Mycobacterium sp. MYCO198283]